MKNILIVLILLSLASCDRTPSEQIIDYSREKYGSDFKEGIIDFSDVFKFKWHTLYIFSPLAYPDDVTKEIGIKYEGDIVPEDRYLFLFVYDRKIVKQYIYSNIQIGFDDDKKMGVYKIHNGKSRYLIKSFNATNYWLYRIK